MVSAISAGALVVAVYVWIATAGLLRHSESGGDTRLLDLQTEAFYAGQLHLQVQPHPALLAAKNPYDPAVNRGYRLLDASLFEGRYYTYYGPAPIVLWLLPWYAATGHHAPPELSALIFGLLALFFQIATLLSAHRYWFPQHSPALLGASIIVVGLGNLMPVLLREHTTVELPVIAGLAFTSGMFFFALRALEAPTRGKSWWGLAGLCWALASASRPNILPLGAPLFLVWCLHAYPSLSKTEIHRSRWLVAGIPTALVILALALYNAARFGNPFDFGNRYTLIELDWTRHSPFSVAHAPTNFYYYVFSLPRLSFFFPFFIEPAPIPAWAPIGYLTFVDRVAGIIWACPFLVYLFGILIVWRRLGVRGRHGLGLILLSVIAISTPLFLFVGSSVRYEAEFALPLVLLAATSVFALATHPNRLLRYSTLTIFPLVGSASVAANLLLAVGASGSFAAANPTLFASLRQAGDRLVFNVIRPDSTKPKTVVLTVRFPSGRAGHVEPLWVNGVAPAANYLYVIYHPGDRVQFGYNGLGPLTPLSHAVAVAPNRAHRITISAGPFLPPADHPAYRSAGLGRGRPFPQLLRVAIDDTVVLDEFVQFHAGLEHNTWGMSDGEHPFGERFTGTILSRHVAFDYPAMTDVIDSSLYGEQTLAVEWPTSDGPGKEPLLRAGSPNQGQLFILELLGKRHGRIGVIDAAGRRQTFSPPFTLEPGVHTLRIASPVFRPDPAWGLAPPVSDPTQVTVKLNDTELIRTSSTCPPVAPRAIVLGDNIGEIGGAVLRFSGKLGRTKSP